MFFHVWKIFLKKILKVFLIVNSQVIYRWQEIEKIIDRILIRQKKRVNRAIFVPDKFTITMSDEDLTN